jgi:hypothetical protein
MEGFTPKPRSEVAKRADTEHLETDRKARNENIATSAHIPLEDLNRLVLLPNSPDGEKMDAIEGSVNGVNFEGHVGKDGMYHARLDGEWLPQGDARQAYLHVRNAIDQRDGSNRVAINSIDSEIDYVEMHEPRVGALRDKFFGGKSPDHPGFSTKAES